LNNSVVIFCTNKGLDILVIPAFSTVRRSRRFLIKAENFFSLVDVNKRATSASLMEINESFKNLVAIV